MKPVRVFILEDHVPLLKNTIKTLKKSTFLELVGAESSAEEAIHTLEKCLQPQVILCDIGLPKMNGIDFCRFVKIKYPEIEVLMWTVYDEKDRVLEAIRYGSAGYLLKGLEEHRMIEAILDVAEGGTVIQPKLARKLLQHFQAIPKHELRYHPEKQQRSLTSRELECLQIVAKGLSNTEAAHVLGLSKATIRTHLEHIYQKLDVGNRVEAVTEGLRQGIIGI